MMRGALTVLAVTALAACGQSEPAGEGASAPAQHSSDNGLLYGLMGFMLGRSTAPTPAPSTVYVDREHRRFVPAAPVPPARSATNLVAPAPPAKAPPITTAPRVAPPAPVAVPAPRPSYSGPSGYSAVRQSAPTYRPSYSSGGRR